MIKSFVGLLGKSELLLIRYGLVGLVINAVCYFVFLRLIYFGMESKAAMTLIYVFGVFISFAGNRRWVFYHQDATSDAALHFVLAHLFGYLLNLLILYVFVDLYGYAHQWVQIVAIIVVAIFLFIIFKYFVFRKIIR